MKSIELKLKADGKEVLLSASQENPKDISLLMSSAFSFLGVSVEEDLFSTNYSKLQGMFLNFKESAELKNATESNECFHSKQRTPTLTEKEEVNPLSDEQMLNLKIAMEKTGKEHLGLGSLPVDGIKIRHGEKVYKTKYNCTCGYSGHHYVKSIHSTINCHECKNTMKVRYSHPDSTPEKLLPTEKFIYFLSESRV